MKLTSNATYQKLDAVAIESVGTVKLGFACSFTLQSPSRSYPPWSISKSNDSALIIERIADLAGIDNVTISSPLHPPPFLGLECYLLFPTATGLESRPSSPARADNTDGCAIVPIDFVSNAWGVQGLEAMLHFIRSPRRASSSNGS